MWLSTVFIIGPLRRYRAGRYDADVNESLPLLTVSQAARLLAANEHSRRAAKTFLYTQGINVGAPELDLLLATIPARPDHSAILAEFSRIASQPRSEFADEFDPLRDLRRELTRRAETVDDFATRVAEEQSLDARSVRDVVSGSVDPPASLLLRILASAGARRVDFDRPRPTRPDAHGPRA